MADKRKLFDSDDEISEEDQSPQKNVKVVRNPVEEMYDQNFQKYIRYLKQFGEKVEETEERIFGDAVWYVNHPLIQTTQISYQKNIGIFDMLDMEKEQKMNDVNTLNHKKVLVVFTFIDNEIQKVIEILEHDLYDSMVMYGEESETKPEKQAPEIMTARIMAVYKKVYDLVRKLMAYIEHIVQQLHSMINKKSNHYKNLFKGLDYGYIIDLLGRSLRAIYIIDCIVENNLNIKSHWEQYKKLVKLARNEPEKFGSTIQSVKRLEKAMNRYENTILSGTCMITITEITYDENFEKSNSPLGKISGNKELREYFEVYFIAKLKEINDNLGTRTDMDEQKKLLQLMCCYTLFRRLYPSEELKDLWRDIWAMQKKFPIIEAHSFVFIYICVFLQKVCPLDKRPRSLDPKDQRAFISQYVASMEQNLTIEIVSSYTKFCVWLSRMESVATSNSSLKDAERKKEKTVTIVHERISNRVYMLCEGFNTILKLYKLLYLCFMLHVSEEKMLPKSLLGKLILALETVKATSFILKKKAQAFDTMIMTKSIARDIIMILNPLYERAKEEQRKKSKETVHKIQIFHFIMKMLDTPISQLKITIIKYAIGLMSDWIISDGQFNHVKSLIKKLQIVAYNRILVQKYQNFSFLYYVKDILPQIFQFKRENPNTCKRLQFLFDGFQDPSFLIKKCPHLANPDELFIDFKKFLISEFQKNYMIPLKRKLQDFLRISTSSMLIEKLEGVRAFGGQLNDLMKMVQFEKIRIFDSIIDIKYEISNSFNSSFYNLNILNMHDMETYEMMRVMGNHIFDLRLHDVFLPNHTIQLDKFNILNIVRNIPTFVTQYKYNILSQRFLQVTSEGKIIACISIQQLSDSIKTHGLGILSTTVNAFYKYLITKVTAFSKFLFMDDIQNLLNKDRKWFKEYSEKQDYPGCYPYQRAQHVYNQIKKMGKFEEETNYLDKFREIVTTVGNSLGFIRLIRSASLNTESKSIQYLPNKAEITETFEEIASKSTLGQTSKLACKELDDILKSLEDKFSDKIDYLNLMIKAFSKIATKQNKHLKLFYLIIPALSINYVEYSTRGKEQINKKITTKAFIYDDGFVLGLSYFIVLLKQSDHFKTMHWDQATTTYFSEAKKESKAASNVDASNHSAKFVEDLNMQKLLLLKKLELMEQQFKFFNYNMISAKILFKKGEEKELKEVPKSPPSNS